MTEQQHPITPTPGLVDEWAVRLERYSDVKVFTEVARWGADQELEACCQWLVCNYNYPKVGNPLHAARRPKSKSLGKTALVALATIEEDLMGGDEAHPNDLVAIRRALERLQELEGQA